MDKMYMFVSPLLPTFVSHLHPCLHPSASERESQWGADADAELATALEQRMDKTYVWINWMAMNQHTAPNLPPELGHIRELVKTCSKGGEGEGERYLGGGGGGGCLGA